MTDKQLLVRSIVVFVAIVATPVLIVVSIVLVEDGGFTPESGAKFIEVLPSVLCLACSFQLLLTAVWAIGRREARCPRKKRPRPLVFADPEEQAEWVKACRRAAAEPRRAAATLAGDSAHAVLGVRADAAPIEIRRAFRRLISVHHPDRGGDPETAKRIISAYALLKSTHCTHV